MGVLFYFLLCPFSERSKIILFLFSIVHWSFYTTQTHVPEVHMYLLVYINKKNCRYNNRAQSSMHTVATIYTLTDHLTRLITISYIFCSSSLSYAESTSCTFLFLLWTLYPFGIMSFFCSSLYLVFAWHCIAFCQRPVTTT